MTTLFHVHLDDGRVCLFVQSPEGLYFSDILDSDSGTVLINTVEYNKTKYNHQNYLNAVSARCLQSVIVNPSYQHFKKILQDKLISNCPVTVTDVEAAEDIFGPSLKVLKGKTTRKNVKKIKSPLCLSPFKFSFVTNVSSWLAT